jgi:uncharacterized protein
MSLRDIIAQLVRPGRDPREDLPPPIFKRGVLKLEDLTPGMELTGTVLNVVDFGAFVDIGMHDSGLVHVSQLADRFVRDPHEVITVGDIVKVWVLEVDKQRRRVSLTMIPPGHSRDAGRRHAKPEGPPRPAPPERGPGGPRPEAPARPQGEAPAGPPRRHERPRFERRPQSGARPPRPDHGPPRLPPKPRPRPRPLTPLTDDMKAGLEPMRSFGDLMQFYEIQHQPGDKERPQKPGPPGRKDQGRRRESKGPPAQAQAGPPGPAQGGREGDAPAEPCAQDLPSTAPPTTERPPVEMPCGTTPPDVPPPREGTSPEGTLPGDVPPDKDVPTPCEGMTPGDVPPHDGLSEAPGKGD